jgi:hypothetical protein
MSCPAKREIRARGTIHICGGLGVGGARSQPLIHTPVAAALGRRHTSGERNYICTMYVSGSAFCPTRVFSSDLSLITVGPGRNGICSAALRKGL